ncbi:hypothetical protein [Pseudonocardia sp. HH130630-07]|uniref:hypothetical protein n=1 Tax=Pseudonocardia sp. HH130630-07 TaxID=1690815 RepID=UPI000A78BADE|nr:hypothetical protein [Pseudonocardia sp. HH130630-07]
MEEPVRVCALDGCAEPIEPVQGRPQRLYCSAAHRLAARQARRAAAQAVGDDKVVETLPWLREPEPVAVIAASAPEPATVAVAARPAPPPRTGAAPGAARAVPPRLQVPATLLRHRRTLALVGATAVLIGGYSMVAPPRTLVGTPVAQERTAEEWAGEAKVALTSLEEQLDTLERTEQAWKNSPHEQGRTPVAVAELRQQRDTLRQQQAALKSQLDAFTSRPEAADALALADQDLAEMDRIVSELPPPTRRSEGQMAAATSLEEQRDLRARRRDAFAEQLRAIEENVDQARSAPLPDDRRGTEEVSGDVMALSRGEKPRKPEPSAPNRPQVLAGGREHDGDRERDDTSTSGPPDPRGPVDETKPRAEGPEGASGRGPGEAREARGVADRGERPQRAERPADDRRDDAGPGRKLGGAVSDAADGVATLTGSKRDGDKADGDKAEGAEKKQAKPVGKAQRDNERAGSGADRSERTSPAGPVEKVGKGVGDTARGVGDAAEGVGGAVDGVTGGLLGGGGSNPGLSSRFAERGVSEGWRVPLTSKDGDC